MTPEEIFENWKKSLGYDFGPMIDYMDTAQSYIDFTDYCYNKYSNLPIHVHEDVSNIYVYIENGVINVKSNNNKECNK
jgi:hypothetical protein